jgi:hypothetical protein
MEGRLQKENLEEFLFENLLDGDSDTYITVTGEKAVRNEDWSFTGARHYREIDVTAYYWRLIGALRPWGEKTPGFPYETFETFNPRYIPTNGRRLAYNKYWGDFPTVKRFPENKELARLVDNYNIHYHYTIALRKNKDGELVLCLPKPWNNPAGRDGPGGSRPGKYKIIGEENIKKWFEIPGHRVFIPLEWRK